MAALTADRNTVARAPSVREPPVKAGALIYQGAMAAVGTDGYAVPASAVAALKVLGRAEARADNTGGASGDIRVRVNVGTFRYANSSGGDLIALKDIGSPAYAVDDQTVALTSASAARPVAGTIFDVDAQGVWVRFS